MSQEFGRKLLRFRKLLLQNPGDVLVILLPSTAYVLGVQLIGIYVSSALFIALFMKIAGKYSWMRSITVGVGVSVSAFVMFEIWFKIPLPKGPIENLIGY